MRETVEEYKRKLDEEFRLLAQDRHPDFNLVPPSDCVARDFGEQCRFEIEPNVAYAYGSYRELD